MKLNTIITYVLVYLLTGGHWNILVPVKADGGSAASGDSDSSVAAPASESLAAGRSLSKTQGVSGEGGTPVSHGSNLSQQPSEIKIFIKDPNDENNIIELDNTLYSSREENDETYFEYKEALKYMSIKFGIQEVWKYDETKFNGKHPDLISYVANKKLFVHFEDEFIAYQKRTDGEWKESFTLKYNLTSSSGLASGESLSESQGVSGDGGILANTSEGGKRVETHQNEFELKPEDYPKIVKVFKANPNDNTKTVELTTSEYTVSSNETCTYMYYYTFDDNVECTRVDCDGKEVWKYDSNGQCGKYPKSLHFNHQAQEFVLYNENCIMIFKKDCNGNWQRTTKSISSKGLISLNLNSSALDLKLYTHDSNDPNSVELKADDYYVLKYAVDAVYTFKDNVKCTLIKCEDKEIWRYDAGDYPKKVSNIVTQNKICIEFAAKHIKCYVKGSNGWKEDYINSTQSEILGSTPPQPVETASSGGKTSGTVVGSLYSDTFGSRVVIRGKSSEPPEACLFA